MERDFHDRAKEVKPDHPLKATRYWVGILFHDKRPENELSEGDFLWIKANGKITVQTVHNEYLKKTPLDTILTIDDKVPKKETKLSELNYYGDNHVIFRAIEAASPEGRQARQTSAALNILDPLQITNSTLTPSHGEASSQSPLKPTAKSPERSQPAPANIPPQQNSSPLSDPPRCLQNPFHPLPQSTFNTSPCHSDHLWQNAAPGQTPTAPDFHLPMTPSTASKERVGLDSIKSEASLPSLEGFLGHAQPDDVSKAESVASEMPENIYLQCLLTETSPELLEIGVERGIQLLNTLQAPLARQSTSEDVSRWVQQIETLRKNAGKARTVVGVMGNTGAGKSSVINAMLDEERLLPTNCMRACTAVVTEMSWNDEEDGQRRYRAEIEFIKKEDWERELCVLFNELLDAEGGISSDIKNVDSDAGIAYAKIKAVYPNKTKEMLTNSSVEQLMNEASVQAVLGTTQQICEAQPGTFYKRLQHYVDSQEKVTGAKDVKKGKDKNKGKEMEYWPLIKVVKIYTKSDALSTGAVVVDLPGVHDSNAARAAVAEGYMKQCTGLWIVAPITRAVDDKAAKSLLGESFKRQLKYDGTYSNVTFICSKTDDISITEAADSLGLESEIHDSQQEVEELNDKKEALEKELDNLKEARDVYDSVYDDCNELQDEWVALKSKLDNGELVYAPAEKSKKRKRTSSSSLKRRNKRATSSQSSSEEDDSPSDGSHESSSDAEQELGEPLTEDQVNAKIEEIKENKKRARREKTLVVEKIRETNKDLAALNERILALKAEMSSICIAGRNNYSKGAIRQDFAAGIKELDQENAAEDNEEQFNPDEDIRDYDEVARSLSVFCVSSKAYQQLRGRLKKDAPVAGFNAVEQTEIPQLQAHCKKLTEAGRADGCRRFLNDLSQLLNSLSLWAVSSGKNSKMTGAQREEEASFLREKLKELENGLEKAVSDCLIEIKETLAENVYEKYPAAISIARADAAPTAERWGAPRHDGGLHFMTYKAICRRNGVYTNAKGLHDFNGQLTEPLYKHLANG